MNEEPGSPVQELHHATRSWYGLPVEITVSTDHYHRVVVGGLPLPHFGLVNLIARWGLPPAEQLEQTWRHELGHVQTLPLILPHLLLLLWPRRRRGPRWLWWLVMLVAHQAAWELAAEGYVILSYCPEGDHLSSGKARPLYGLLWGGMAALAVGGTLWALSSRATGEQRENGA